MKVFQLAGLAVDRTSGKQISSSRGSDSILPDKHPESSTYVSIQENWKGSVAFVFSSLAFLKLNSLHNTIQHCVVLYKHPRLNSENM